MLNNWKQGIFDVSREELVDRRVSSRMVSRNRSYVVASLLAECLFSPEEEDREYARQILEPVWEMIEEEGYIEKIRKACWGNEVFVRRWEEVKDVFGVSKKGFVNAHIEDYRENIYNKEVV